MNQEKVFLLAPAIQQYAWGKPGNQSAVAGLAASCIPGFEVKKQDPYAELWMGTHPKGPNSIPSKNGVSLSSWLSDNASSIGEKVKQAFPNPGQLPYLFKVLSVNKSLSIQAHPNKAHAEALHSDRPDVYPDPNHKPEMAIALTPFEALCGFRPKQEISVFLQSIPEFRTLIGNSLIQALVGAEDEEEIKGALGKCFTALMQNDKETVKENVGKLVSRLETSGDKDSTSELVLRLHSQFPLDVGCFSVFFLNHLLLQPGEAIFLEANLPHAYLQGDCLECMACSDNVVRAGLTPKYIDVTTLCTMLNYSCKPADDNKFSSKQHPTDPYVTVFSPPVPDFAVDQVKVPKGISDYTVPAVDSASILLVIQGEAQVSDLGLKRGSVLFVSAGEPLSLQIQSQTDGFLVFRAYCDL